MPEAHANVAESSSNRKRGHGRESGRGRRVPCSRSKKREKPMVGLTPRRKMVTTVGKSKANAIDVEQRGIGPIIATPPSTSLTFTSKARTREKVNMSPTS